MAIDVNRGAFVKEEYRFEERSAPEVLALQPQARVIKLETNLDLAAAGALADEIMDEHKHVAQAYEVVLAGVDVCDDQSFIGSPPTFTCNFPDWPVDQTDLLRVVSVVVDYQNWLTTITIKGPQT
ncbi:hypothetical protein [Sphingobium sp.]|uniref:hypothetical protein n=1 Tax=Sphingobium sp. TaxID=1912891 RepID=UPI00262F4067|nr:hypothetical protein [Sphingobium sp.]